MSGPSERVRRGAPRALLLAVLLAAGAPAIPAPAEEEPWTITGQSLEGSRAGSTQLLSPRIERGSTVITARTGTWRHADEIVILTDDVVLRDSSRTITAERGTFDRAQGLGILTGNVRGNGPEGELAARELWYWRDEGRIELRDSARVVEESRILEAERIDYDTNLGEGEAFGKVRLFDPIDSTLAFGRHARFDRREDWAMLIGSPVLHRPGDEGGASLDLFADTLLFERGGEYGEARGNVRLHRGSVRAESERAVFDFDRDLLRLEGEPKARDPDGVVTGDSMAVVLRGGRAERLEVLGNALLRHRPAENPGERSFVTGDTLIAYIDSTGVREIQVRGNARSLYLPSPADRAGEVGSNLSRGDLIRVHFGEGEAKRVELEGSATGAYTPPRVRPDTTTQRLSDSLYVARAFSRFLAGSEGPLPDSLERAGPFEPSERVRYAGRSVVFFVPERRIEISEDGTVHYQNLELESEEIVFEALRDRVVALGEPTLRDPNSELVGERMVYRIDRQHGFVYQGYTQFDGGRYKGEEVKRVDRSILLVREGDYTTCEADTAHYHFHANRMKIKLKDRVIARPVVLYLKNIPLMALPYWIFPIRKGRSSGVLMPDVEFGFDEQRGRFLRNIGYYYVPNDYADAMLWGDYYERNPRWILNAQLRYKVRYLLGGQVFGSYSGEGDSRTGRRRWDIQGSHEHTLGDRFDLKVRANFVSDKDYRDDREFGGSVDERLNRQLKSNFSLRKSWSTTRLSVAADRTEYLDEESSSIQVQQSIPSVDFSINSFPIGREADALGRGERLPFLSTVYARVSSSFRSTFVKPWGEETEDNQAARVNFGLSDNRSIGPYAKVSPSFSATGAWFRRDARGESHGFGAVWSAGLSARSTLYGTFPIDLGPLQAMRHVVEPSVSYSYAPGFPSLRYTDEGGIERSLYPSVGGIGLAGSEVSSMRIGVTQRFHLKLDGEDPKKPRKIDNLILWTTSTSYDFRRRGEGEKPLSNIVNSIRVNPARFLGSNVSVTHDPYRKVAISLSVRTQMNFSGGGGTGPADTTGGGGTEEYGGFGLAEEGSGRPGEAARVPTGPWSLSLTHNYSRGESRSSERSTANVRTSFTPTRNWRFSYSIYYDLQERDVRSQSFTLSRDLHCWTMKLDRRISGGNSSYYFRIHIKGLPDVKYEREQR
ncbi:MAG: LPS assembly protein LptD [Candidatus Eisenbacteria bacterium]|nr:LPS assembly protein LptD [Candidatus Latescibacterota bacterium]MBD3301565.1 LPS assembly protein LptD [Candidatus Eisenbacteria bacterium]